LQRKIISLVEVTLSTAIGFTVALLAQIYIIFPLYDIEVNLWANVEITIMFTVVSVLRSYGVRRLFNWLHLTQRLQ
jgi:hypothetical protein